MKRIASPWALAWLVCAAAAPAQVVFGDMGFTVQSSHGTAGAACWGFSCAPRPLEAAARDTLTLTVRAPLGAPYVVGVAPGAGLCQPVPGLWHELVLTPPLWVPIAGTITQPNQARFCYDGLAVQRVVLPPLAAGDQLGLQAAAVVGTPLQPSTGWAFSSAVLVTVR